MLKQDEKTQHTSESNKLEFLMANFSNLAYKNLRRFKNRQKLFKYKNLSAWEYFQPDNIPNRIKLKSFTAINNETKEIVIIFKGSEPIPSFDLEGIVNDWCIADINLVIGKIPKEFYDAYDYVNSIKDVVSGDFKIFMTGHSLGGSLVQLLCALKENNHITGYTFNPFGVKHLIPLLEKEGFGVSSDFVNINNFSIDIDLVSNHNKHIGKVFVVKYKKTFLKTIYCIISELPKILTDIPFKIVKSIKYYFNTIKWFFIKINGHLMNNFTSEFNYEEYSENEDGIN